MFNLDDKVALVTGSSRGIGKAIAVALAAQGASVIVSSRTSKACESAAAEIRDLGGDAIAIRCDINRREELESLVDKSLEERGQIDILICNAAVNPYFGPLSEIDDGAYERTMDANVKHTLVLCNHVLPQMAERRNGSVIIVSSIAGLKGTGTLGIYAISKAAELQLARNLAVEWGDRNIRVNSIAPGLIRTDFSRALWENPDVYEATISSYPLRRIGEPNDVAGAAVFLASSASEFVTGQTIVVDGGSTIGGTVQR
jgi:NAD(P)-dependent dehydrogenase (short-subunit alcohol dehydrogenase family)